MKLIQKIIATLKSPKFIKFFIAGFSAFLVDTLILNFLEFNAFKNDKSTILHLISVSKLISASFGVVVSFTLNRYWAFKASNESVKKQAYKFFLIFIFNIFLASILFRIFQIIFESLPFISDFEKIIPTIANIGTTGTIMFISFFFYSKFVFNGKPEPFE